MSETQENYFGQFVRLETQDDWQTHRALIDRSAAAKNNGVGVRAWFVAQPPEYPVLVTTNVVNGVAIPTFVTRRDVALLTVDEPLTVPTPVLPVRKTAMPKLQVGAAVLKQLGEAQRLLQETTEFVGTAQRSNREFAKHVSATQLTIVSILLDKGLVTTEDYARKFTANMAVVDRWESRQDDRARIAKAVDAAPLVMPPDAPKEERE